MPVTTCPVDLDQLVAHLDAAIPVRSASEAWFLRLAGGAVGELTIGLHPIGAGTDHPVDDLLGFTADPSWTAAGIVVSGRRRDLDSPSSAPCPIRITYVVGRDGSEASLLRHTDDGSIDAQLGPPEGRVSDCLRRVLGLATPAPPAPVLHWHAAVWLEAVLAAALDQPSSVSTWALVAAHHPLVGRRAAPTGPQLVALAQRVCAGQTWADRRAGVTAASVDEPGLVSPEVAAWMDDGMFARWHFAALPDPVDVLIDLAGLLAASVMEQVLEVVEAWDLW